MTDRAQPGAEGSHLYNVEMGEVFGEIGYNKVIRADDPSRSAQNSDTIDETVLNEFEATHSSSSLTVTIDAGEAFVDGWVARDVSTDVDLASSTNGQTVYVGWDTSAFYDSDIHSSRDDADAVIIGLDSAFGTTDPQLPLWTFDTDSSGVTSATDERRYMSPSGGVSFVDTQEPAYGEGETWVNPDTGVYYAGYDDGNGGDWHPIPPIAVTEEAITFGESDVSVTHNKTTVSNNSIELHYDDTAYTVGSTADRTNDDSDATSSGWLGIKINPNTRLNGIRTTVSSFVGEMTDARISDGDGNTLDQKSVSAGPGDTIELNATLYDGTTYNLEALCNTHGRYNSTSGFTDSSTDIDIVGAAGSSVPYNFTDVTALVAEEATEGDAIISWDSGVPTQIKSWDLATFQRTLDGETVTVDVQRYDGSSWVTEFTDISPNFDISTINESEDVRLKANLSRNDTANNPTFDYAARRFTR